MLELFERKGEVRGFVGSVLRRSYPFLDWLENTIVVFAGSVTVTLVASTLAAYALGRLRPPGFRWWRRAIFAAYVVPHTILFIPLYQVVLRLHLDDNILALVLIYPTLALPFCVWILSAYFQHLPREVEESALVEGAGRVTAFFHIILPMSRPVIVAAGIFGSRSRSSCIRRRQPRMHKACGGACAISICRTGTSSIPGESAIPLDRG